VTATVILLNGVGSAGKGSIARALQEIASAPYLHVEMDAFLAMLPPASWNHPEGLRFETLEQEGKPAVAIHSGPVVERALAGMRRAVAAMAASGNNLIVDEVMERDTMAEYEALLRPFRLCRVGVLASLEVLEARERERGDRLIGLARWQYPRIHKGQSYDLEVDTSDATALQCAEQIKSAFGL
jgi:chloramphenicol 3-O phosphotransferase